MNPKKEQLTVFPDTNVLLHYPPFKEIDWLKLCSTNYVKIVICLQVIHEIDEKKSDSFFSNRANRVIKDIKQIKKTGSIVKENVSLEVFNAGLRFDELPQSLRPDSGDDRIVHLIKKYQSENPNEDISILTEDYGMQLRCEANNIPVIEPDNTKRLESPKSDLEKKHQQVALELSNLKNRLPDIEVLISKYQGKSESDDKQPLIIEDLPQAYTTILDYDAEVKKEKSRLSWQPQFIKIEDNISIVIPNGKYDYYCRKLDEYLLKYRKWLQCFNEAQPILAFDFDFSLFISNNGTSPAEDLDVFLTFPPIFQYLWCNNKHVGKFPYIPNKPEPPKKDENIFSELLKGSDVSLNYLSQMPRIHSPFEPITNLKENKNGSFIASIHIPKLKHYESKKFHGSAAFKSIELLRSFEVNFEIIAGNLPRNKTSQLPIQVKPI
jgi:regulator of replication initiation timing